ncbi:glycosyltransferase family 2 protein [Noviherbaspirillum sp. CPCC 100848]|uniref:Glycosyltransferase family 2 protein n=1 Tax=Noviherbaspirillum album TaxID=3080276 RepID=A0ABU6JCR3_9BURK|nr:glycosyltransferase family 2 protein [Noviherbaspirillum sp. CPCC 100848]MEC4721318.1 glycosyltransferase family 2 protein [Noviherbaspirillum sp. CPCC 100848]
MKPSLPTISMVTCSYQQARFLDQTIRSVRAQNYSGLEYIIIDGGSTDGSRDIIASHSDALAYWVSERDHGQSHALMKGFARATGDIAGWLCSDDILLPGALKRVGEFFRDHPEVDAVFGDSIWIDINGAPLRPKREMGFNRFVFLHDYNYVSQPSMFWRRRLYEAVGGVRPYFHLAMDNDLWERFSARTKIAHMPHYLSCMRYYEAQKTNTSRLRQRGRREGLLVQQRASRIARATAARPLLQAAARFIRIIQKAAAGGYTAKVPIELLPWLDAHATQDPNTMTSTLSKATASCSDQPQSVKTAPLR